MTQTESWSGSETSPRSFLVHLKGHNHTLEVSPISTTPVHLQIRLSILNPSLLNLFLNPSRCFPQQNSGTHPVYCLQDALSESRYHILFHSLQSGSSSSSTLSAAYPPSVFNRFEQHRRANHLSRLCCHGRSCRHEAGYVLAPHISSTISLSP